MVALMLFIASLFSIHYAAQFEDVSALKTGMPVVYRGIEIGSVDGMDLGTDGKPRVDFKIQRRYRTYLREGCALRLQKEEGRLELIFVDQDKHLLEAHALIPGLIGAGDYFAYGARRIQETLRDFKIKQQLDDLTRDMDGAWQKGRETFKKEWPKFKERLLELKEKLTGDKKAQKEIERVVDDGDSKSK